MRRMNTWNKKLSVKYTEIEKLNNIRKDQDIQLKKQEKQYMETISEADGQIKMFSKALKIKEKDCHNLEKKLSNCDETIPNFKAKNVKLENDVKELEKKLKKIKPKSNLVSVSGPRSVDLNYFSTEPPPPISYLCRSHYL